MRPRRVSEVLASGGLLIHAWVGRILGVGFVAQCCIVSGAVAATLLGGSALDGTLLMESRDIGLLQHPGIWAFILLQVALPLTIKRSLLWLLLARGSLRQVTRRGQSHPVLVVSFLRFVCLRDPRARAAATVVYGIGLAAFVWNTYQNQLPGVLLPYDFWDSTNHAFGYWLTRVYKLYLLVWLLPYLALIHIGVMVVVLRAIRSARLSGQLLLLPFHQDGVGGLGFVPKLATTPIAVTLAMATVQTAAVVIVHRTLDVTPLIGVSIVALGALAAYALPIVVLRGDIVALKRELVTTLAEHQQSHYQRIMDSGNVDIESLRQGHEALDYFDKVAARVRAISNYPHLSKLLGYVGILLTPSVLSLLLQAVEGLLPIVGPVPGKR